MEKIAILTVVWFKMKLFPKELLYKLFNISMVKVPKIYNWLFKDNGII